MTLPRRLNDASFRSRLLAVGGGASGSPHYRHGPASAADEFSGADKLRSLYSAEFRFTQDGLPVVPVALAQGVKEVRVEGEGGLRLLPEGDGGPEVRADDAWRVRRSGPPPPRLRYWPVVWRGRPQQGAEASAQARAWRARGMEAQSFEQGTLFAVAGEVLDRREVVVGVSPAPTFEAAEKTLEKLRASAKPPGPSRRRLHRAGRSPAWPARGRRASARRRGCATKACSGSRPAVTSRSGSSGGAPATRRAAGASTTGGST